MNNNNIKIVVSNELCFGCGSCNVGCPVKAIKMDWSPIGRLLPVVNEDICTLCGLCLKVCPGIDLSGKFSEKIEPTLIGEVKEVLLGRSSDESTFSNAQSGGATTETLAFLFDEGRIDAALIVAQENLRAKYCVIYSKKELYASQSSQYTPVDLVSGLQLLNDYKHVAVVGLPCHLEGIVKLKDQIPNRYSNIDYMLGLICAGTLSQLMVDVLKIVGKKRIGIIKDKDQIKWRHKKYSNYQRADIAIIDPDENVRMLDNNIRHTAKDFLTAPRCKLCFDKMNLYADIVYGDSWGVRGDNTKDGSNVILCRTDKGKSLIDEMISKNRLIGRSCSIEEISKGQGLTKKKKTVEKILSIYEKKSFSVPGWAKCGVFSVVEQPSIDQMRIVEEYLSRSNKSSTEVVREVSAKIKKRLIILKIKRIIKRIIKRM